MNSMSSTGSDAETGPTADGYHVRAGKATDEPDRNVAMQRVMTAVRELGLATITLNSAVARSMEIHPTDAWLLTYMRNLASDVPLTAGDLARVTGLTTGAITGAIDRLEAHGYVRRERDPHDRRKVIIAPTEESAKIVGVFRPLVENSMDLALGYTTEELRTIVSYLEGTVALTEATVARLRRM